MDGWPSKETRSQKKLGWPPLCVGVQGGKESGSGCLEGAKT